MEITENLLGNGGDAGIFGMPGEGVNLMEEYKAGSAGAGQPTPLEVLGSGKDERGEGGFGGVTEHVFGNGGDAGILGMRREQTEQDRAREEHEKAMSEWRDKNYSLLEKEVLDEPMEEGIGEFGLDKGEIRRGRANDTFLLLNGVDPDAEYAAARDGYAYEHFAGRGVGDDGVFYGEVKREMEERRNGREVKEKIFKAASDQVFLRDGGFFGDDGKSETEFVKGLRGLKGYRAESEKGYLDEFRSVREALREKTAPYLEASRRVFEAWKNKGDVGGVVHEAYVAVPKEKRREFLDALAVRAKAMPEEERRGFLGNLLETTERGVGGLGRNAVETVTTYAASDPYRFAGISGGGTLYAQLQAGETTEMHKAESAQLRDFYNFRADVRRIGEETYDPIQQLLDKDSVMGFVERGVYGMPTALASTGMAMIPYVGWGLTFASAAGGHYEEMRRDMLDRGASDEVASGYAEKYSVLAGGVDMFLERFGGDWLMNKGATAGISRRVIGGLSNAVKSRVARGAAHFAIGELGELSTERLQDFIAPVIGEMVGSYGGVDTRRKWLGKGGELDGFWLKTLETAVSLAPLAGMHVKHSLGMEADVREASARLMEEFGGLERKAFGVRSEAEERLAKALESGGQADLNEAYEEVWKTLDPKSDEAKAASVALAKQEARAREVAREEAAIQNPQLTLTRDADGWAVARGFGEDRVELGRYETAGEAQEVYAREASWDAERHANQIAELAGMVSVTEEAHGEDGRTVELAPMQGVRGEGDVRLVFGEKGVARFRAQQMRLAEVTGTQAVASQVFGVNMEEELRGNVSRIFAGATPLTIFHEKAHGALKGMMESGEVSWHDVWDLMARVDANLQGKTTSGGEALRFLKLDTLVNFEGGRELTQEEMMDLDEGFAELIETEVFRNRKKKYRGEVTKAILAQGAVRGKGGSKLRALMQYLREWLGLTMYRAKELKRAKVEGKLDLRGVHGKLRELAGFDEDVELREQTQEAEEDLREELHEAAEELVAQREEAKEAKEAEREEAVEAVEEEDEEDEEYENPFDDLATIARRERARYDWAPYESGDDPFSMGRERGDAFAGLTEQDLEEAFQSALAASRKSGQVNTDDVRHHLKGYQEADPLTRDNDSHEYASAINKRIIAERLKEESKTGRVILLAGGGGSGKGTAFQFNASEADFYIDGVMGNLGKAEKLIEQIRASGRKPSITYVHRPFEQAFRGAIYRHLGGDRVVPLGILAPAHVNAQETFLALQGVEKFVTANDGSLSDIREIPIDELIVQRYVKNHDDGANFQKIEGRDKRRYSSRLDDQYAGQRRDAGGDPQAESRGEIEAGSRSGAVGVAIEELKQQARGILAEYLADDTLTPEQAAAFDPEFQGQVAKGGSVSFSTGKRSLPAKILIDGEERHTMNSEGKPIADTEEGVRNFYKWFGDSEVVDADGKPLVVYHNTNSDFNTFKQGGNGLIQFTPDKELFSSKGDRKIPAYLTGEIKRNRTGKILSVLSPTQIKSATDNRGTFDGGNADIRFSLGLSRIEEAALREEMVKPVNILDLSGGLVPKKLKGGALKNFINDFIQEKFQGKRIGKFFFTKQSRLQMQKHANEHATAASITHIEDVIPEAIYIGQEPIRDASERSKAKQEKSATIEAYHHYIVPTRINGEDYLTWFNATEGKNGKYETQTFDTIRAHSTDKKNRMQRPSSDRVRVAGQDASDKETLGDYLQRVNPDFLKNKGLDRFLGGEEDLSLSLGRARMAGSLAEQVAGYERDPAVKGMVWERMLGRLREIGAEVESVGRVVESGEYDGRDVRTIREEALANEELAHEEIRGRYADVPSGFEGRERARRMRRKREAALVDEAENDVWNRYGDLLSNGDLVRLRSQPVHEYLAGSGKLGGRLMSRSEAERSGRYDGKVHGDYDGQNGVGRSLMGGSLMPDQAAQELYEEGLLREESADALWDALYGEMESVVRRKGDLRRVKEELKVAKADAKEVARREAEQYLGKLAAKREEMKGEMEAASREIHGRYQEALRERERGMARDAKGELVGRLVAPRERMVRALSLLTAITNALPVRLRGKIGGVMSVTKLGSDERVLEFLQGRLRRAEEVLEHYLQGEYTGALRKLLKVTMPARDVAGKARKGKAGADVHELFAEVREMWKKSAVEAEVRAMEWEARAAAEHATPEEVAHAQMVAGAVRLVGGWSGQSAAQRGRAFTSLQHLWEIGYLSWRIEQKRRAEARAFEREKLVFDTGKEGGEDERSEAELKANGVVGVTKSVGYSLLDFEQVMKIAFGEESEAARRLVRMQREAEYGKVDAVAARDREVEELFTGLAGSVLKGEKLHYEMAKKSVVVRGIHFSQLEAVSVSMLWEQEDGRRHMRGQVDENGRVVSRWGYDQAFVDEVEAVLTGEAKAVREFLRDRYRKEWGELNPVYRAVYGVDMPRHENYSPVTVTPEKVGNAEMIDPVTGQVSRGVGGTPGSLKQRGSGVARPEFRDVLQTYAGHYRQMEHWKHFAPLMQEMGAVLGTSEVQDAVEARGGKELSSVLRGWADVFQAGGTRDAAAHLALNRKLSEVTGRAATMALVGRVSVLMVQSTQLGAAVVQMPVGSYLKRFGQLMTGQLKWGDALRSEYIQRRLREMPPLVRAAMEGMMSRRPSEAKHFARRMGQLIGGADALFTAGTYAMIYDYQVGLARKMGMDEAGAVEYAHREAARLTDQVAQPTRMGTRSLFENTSTNPATKLLWAFASEARQKGALMAYAAARAKENPARFLKTAWLVFGVGGAMVSLLRAGIASARDEDEDEFFSEKYFSPERLAMAMLTDPLKGIPFFGDMISDALYASVGMKNWNSGLLSGGAGGFRVVHDWATEDDHEWTLRDAEALMQTVGYFSGNAAAATSFMHVIRDGVRTYEGVKAK